MGAVQPSSASLNLMGVYRFINAKQQKAAEERKVRVPLRLYLHFVMYLYSAFPTSSACNESCVWEEERRCLAGGESKAAAGIK
ncbi:MAG TPA: hypothetical protein VKO18_10780, partial [Terriglobia bacterium]|nr:hypothetical protein [Terriglobia bacterium]